MYGLWDFLKDGLRLQCRSSRAGFWYLHSEEASTVLAIWGRTHLGVCLPRTDLETHLCVQTQYDQNTLFCLQNRFSSQNLIRVLILIFLDCRSGHMHMCLGTFITKHHGTAHFLA